MRKINIFILDCNQTCDKFNLIFALLNSTIDFWLIDSNFVGVMRFYKDKDHSGKSIDYMFIEEGIIMGIHGENPPLMKTRKKIVIEKARLLSVSYTHLRAHET